MSKALEILGKRIGVEERAEGFLQSIERNINRDVIDTVKEKIDKINDQLFELKDFSIVTNANKGQYAITRAECEHRFKQIIDLDYQKALLELELKVKQGSFDFYFKEDEQTEDKTS